MKRVIKLVLLVSVLLISAVIIFSAYFYGYLDTFNNVIDGQFDIYNHPYQTDRYASIMNREEFQSDIVLGKVENISDLRKEVQQIWIKNYGPKIRKQQPYEVLYDPVNRVYLVRGTLTTSSNDVVVGGTAHILVEEDTGVVLAIWHES